MFLMHHMLILMHHTHLLMSHLSLSIHTYTYSNLTMNGKEEKKKKNTDKEARIGLVWVGFVSLLHYYYYYVITS